MVPVEYSILKANTYIILIRTCIPEKFCRTAHSEIGPLRSVGAYPDNLLLAVNIMAISILRRLITNMIISITWYLFNLCLNYKRFLCKCCRYMYAVEIGHSYLYIKRLVIIISNDIVYTGNLDWRYLFTCVVNFHYTCVLLTFSIY